MVGVRVGRGWGRRRLLRWSWLGEVDVGLVSCWALAGSGDREEGLGPRRSSGFPPATLSDSSLAVTPRLPALSLPPPDSSPRASDAAFQLV